MAGYGAVSGKGSCSTKDRLLVAAIDFGTTYSGWAFSFKHEYDTEPTKVSSKQWYGGQHVSLKAPTTLLIKPDGKTLEAFGYEAENKYADLAADEQKLHQEYYYFKRFKMLLFDKIGLKRNITLEDDKGLTLPAKTVFSLAIAYLRKDLLETCNQRLATATLDDSEIHWVLTVPAIWNDSAKQFMREAAVEGGIKTEQLTIALEPEAASLYCRLLPVEKMIGQCGMSISRFRPGAKYMVLDAGGGTVDITIHEVMEGNKLRELHKASGGAWGGTKVDECFIQMLIKIVGNPVLRRFQRESTDDYLDMMREFEVKKRDITPDKSGKLTVRLATALKELFVEETDEDMQTAICQTNYAGNMSFTGDKLRIDASVMKNLFSEATDSIVSHVRSLLKEPAVQGTENILMVGGFSESPMLQDKIRRNFPNMRVIVPEEAGLVVLKGAVVFGHNPGSVAERVCRYTYGIEVTGTFNSSIHDQSKKVMINGKEHCNELFDKHVEVGQTVKYGEPQMSKTYSPLTEQQNYIGFTLYASSQKSPKYVTDLGVLRLGNVGMTVRDMSVPLSERVFNVDLTFSGTEIEIRATEKRTGQVANITTDFLG